jgi:nicotinate dehydrogenase subunit A
MVLLDGKAQTSCLLPVSSVKNRRITTLEGLSQKNNELHPVQKAFVQEQAAQCGYCMNGMVMAAVALLADNPHPDRKTIRNRLHLSLCRCGSHARILRAIQRAIELV